MIVITEKLYENNFKEIKLSITFQKFLNSERNYEYKAKILKNERKKFKQKVAPKGEQTSRSMQNFLVL